MRKLTSRQMMVPVVVVLTAAHLAFRLSERSDEPAFVSALEAGSTVAAPGLDGMRGELDSGACLKVIVFSADCPFCQHAADREMKTLSESSRAERLWYTDAETTSLSYFVSEHLHRKPRISPELVSALKIQGVPALFVLSATGEVRWVGGYHGDESDRELADRCSAGPANQNGTT